MIQPRPYVTIGWDHLRIYFWEDMAKGKWRASQYTFEWDFLSPPPPAGLWGATHILRTEGSKPAGTDVGRPLLRVPLTLPDTALAGCQCQETHTFTRPCQGSWATGQLTSFSCTQIENCSCFLLLGILSAQIYSNPGTHLLLWAKHLCVAKGLSRVGGDFVFPFWWSSF